VSRDNQAEQDKLRRAAKLRQEAEKLEREAQADASRPGPKNRDVKDSDFQATFYTPPTAKDIFKEEDDPVAKAINSRRPLNPTRRRDR
jgi:hypothetical protein